MLIQDRPLAIVFHGFLGNPEDFNFLNTKFNIVSLDLRPQIRKEGFESWEQMTTRILKDVSSLLQTHRLSNEEFDRLKMTADFKNIPAYENKQHVYFFSYSMGSKVLHSLLTSVFEVAKSLNFNMSLVFLSSHYGIYNSVHQPQDESLHEIEKNVDNNGYNVDLKFREKMNQKFLNILKSNNLDLFYKEWNGLALFSQDTFDEKPSALWDLEQIKWYFETWNRSQACITQEMIDVYKMAKSIFLFYGSEDPKYKEQGVMFEKIMKDSGYHAITSCELKDRSHRLLKDKDFEIICSHVLR